MVKIQILFYDIKYTIIILNLVTVQPDPKISALIESDTGTAYHSGPHVPVVQTKCAPGGQQLHTSDHGDHYFATGCYTQVINNRFF